MSCCASSWPASRRAGRAVAAWPCATSASAAPPAPRWSPPSSQWQWPSCRSATATATPRNDVKVVTIDIGGNDVFGVVSSCAAGPTPECAALIQARLQAFAANFALILDQLRAAAGPDTVIIAMTYYNPLYSCHLAQLAALADAVLEGGVGWPWG